MTLELSVTGMSCGNCEASVVEALEGVDGVESATADHEADRATVEGDADALDAIVAVEDAGYEADTA
ncbi:heavy-metal-associated domain-containing protein [Halobaculum sp. MBLA0147]|uniref:heavy-metal-associated domain-containing protein n=1 Tax=Halobaculum sp. MBLA0147 TaxID=3079934 RepID=UPI003526532C